MRDLDRKFTGSVPENYDRYLKPLLFTPYAEDLAERLAYLTSGALLETACGTGAVTKVLRDRLPVTVKMTATDLNSDMLAMARTRMADSNLEFAVADAQDLPFADESFDAVVCQFGVMFFPDKKRAFAEGYRVLKPRGAFIFNLWDRLDKSPICQEVARSIETNLPEIAPVFLSRVPFSCANYEPVVQTLRSAAFDSVEVHTVEKTSRANSAQDAVTGLSDGSPLRSELNTMPEQRVRTALDDAVRNLEKLYGCDEISAPMSAHIVRATRA